jgi:hypothetical protein
MCNFETISGEPIAPLLMLRLLELIAANTNRVPGTCDGKDVLEKYDDFTNNTSPYSNNEELLTTGNATIAGIAYVYSIEVQSIKQEEDQYDNKDTTNTRHSRIRQYHHQPSCQHQQHIYNVQI